MIRTALLLGALVLAGCGSDCKVDTPVISDPATPATVNTSIDMKFDVHTNGACNNDGRFIQVGVIDPDGVNHVSETFLTQDTHDGVTFHGDTQIARLSDAGTYTFEVIVGLGMGPEGAPLAFGSKDFDVAP
jgi:hypothetical protein